MESNVLQRIKESVPHLTKSQSIIADYILINYVEVAFLTLDQLAGIVGTSTGSIMRLTFKLGYSGYSEFQKDLQEILRHNAHPSSGTEENEYNQFANDVLANFVEVQTGNIKKTAETLTSEDIDKILSLIIKANKIYFVGFRSSQTVVHFMYYRLHRLFSNCELLMIERGDLPEKLVDINSNDLIIACSFPRYSKNVIEFVEDAKKQGAKTISFSDTHASPIKLYSDILLPCLSDSAPFHNSVISAIFIAEYLMQEIVIKYSGRVSERLDKVESILSKKNSLYIT